MHFPKLPLAASGILLTFSLSLPLHAQSSATPNSIVAQSERSIVRSQEILLRSESLMKQAREEQSHHHLKEAYEDALAAVSMVPSGTAAEAARSALISSYTNIALAYAHELIDKGVFTDSIAEQNNIRNGSQQPVSAESVLKTVLDPSINPGSRDAVNLLSELEQPDIFNKTVTPKSAARRDEVVRLLREASELAQSGRNELALRKYEQVLVNDPYNNAARKGMEDLHQTESKYADEAYNETRSQMLWQVEKSWERPPRRINQGRSSESIGEQPNESNREQIQAKLNSIIIQKVDLTDTPVSEAIEWLKQKSVENDPNKKGINIFLKLPTSSSSEAPGTPAAGATAAQPPAAGTGVSDPRINLHLYHIPLYEVLKYICSFSNLKIKIEPYAISIVPLTETTDVLFTKTYKVPPSFIPLKSIDSQNSSVLPQAGAPQSTNYQSRVAPREDAQVYLTRQGILFPTGASAVYLDRVSKLVVRNTRDNIDEIDSLVDAAMGAAPSQVSIETQFLDISQNDLKELGFDWLLGPFSIGGGMYGSGGGGSNSVTSSDYPFNTAGMNGLTPGALRTGNQAIPQTSINALLANQGTPNTTTPAPGVFSIGGIFSNPQFQLVIRGLNQKTGVDLLSRPSVTAKSGAHATIKVIDEFIYPKQWDPPQVPSTISNSPGTLPSVPTVTPAFPRNFTMEPLGVILDVTPTILGDGISIDLDLEPRVVDFDGFINYGSPINTVGYVTTVGAFGLELDPTTQTLTTNTIYEPVFSMRKIKTYVNVWDNHTVALGGLISENVVKAQDKVPFLGDMPLVGRLFRSDNDQKIKEDLIIFVTPRILNPDGQPRHEDVEELEIVKPLGLPPDLPQPTTSSATVRSK